MQPKHPKYLINPLERVDPNDKTSPFKSSRGGPLLLCWYNDPKYRIWEEAKAITARWGVTQRLAPQVQNWLQNHGITAYVEFKAAGFRSDEAAKADFEAFTGRRRGGVEPQSLPLSEERSTVELRADET